MNTCLHVNWKATNGCRIESSRGPYGAGLYSFNTISYHHPRISSHGSFDHYGVSNLIDCEWGVTFAVYVNGLQVPKTCWRLFTSFIRRFSRIQLPIIAGMPKNMTHSRARNIPYNNTLSYNNITIHIYNTLSYTFSKVQNSTTLNKLTNKSNLTNNLLYSKN